MIKASRPVVLSLILDSKSQDTLTALRTQFFPRNRNFLSAHITLFHALPPSDQLFTLLERTLADFKPFNLGLGDPFLFKNGSGVALNMKSFKAKELHQTLLDTLWDARVELTEQDQRPMRGVHVTICNKAKEAEAKDVFQQMQDKMEGLKKELPTARGLGVAAWEYQQDSTWKHLTDYMFKK